MADNHFIGIKNSWTLLDFARLKGKMQIGGFVNKSTGETFRSCIFTDERNNRTFVSFSSKLGELTPAEVLAQKDRLQVVELDNCKFVLCRKGEGGE